MRFARAVLSRPYIFTIVLLIANFWIFLLMWESSGRTMSTLISGFPEPVLLAYGAKLNSLISGQFNGQHQWWRFVTPMFVHVNLPHVLVNMYSLWMIGPYVEKLYGSAKFVVFWVLTGVGGVAASFLTVVRPGTSVGTIGRFVFKAQDVASAGASGALFGLVGVLFVFGIKFRHELPEGFKRAFGTGMLPVILLNLFIGYLGRGFIDNAAHLGGLVSGGALALVVGYRRPGERAGITLTWKLLQVATLGLVVVSFLKMAQHFRDPAPGPMIQPVSQITHADWSEHFLGYAKAIQDGNDAFYSAVKERNASSVDAAVTALGAAPHLDTRADQLRDELKALLQQAKQFATNSQALGIGSAKSPEEQRERLQSEQMLWSKEYDQWLKTSGRQYMENLEEQ